MGPPGGTTVKEEETVVTTVTTVEPIYSRDKIIKRAKNSIMISAMLNVMLALVCLIMAAVAASQAVIDISSVKQITDDWGTTPYVELNVRDSCLSGE